MKKEFFMETKIIELKKTILEDNDADADVLRKELKELQKKKRKEKQKLEKLQRKLLQKNRKKQITML